jgi:hypothetical protein
MNALLNNSYTAGCTHSFAYFANEWVRRAVAAREVASHRRVTETTFRPLRFSLAKRLVHGR